MTKFIVVVDKYINKDKEKSFVATRQVFEL